MDAFSKHSVLTAVRDICTSNGDSAYSETFSPASPDVLQWDLFVWLTKTTLSELVAQIQAIVQDLCEQEFVDLEDVKAGRIGKCYLPQTPHPVQMANLLMHSGILLRSQRDAIRSAFNDATRSDMERSCLVSYIGRSQTLRWDPKDIAKGYLVFGGTGETVTLQDAIDQGHPLRVKAFLEFPDGTHGELTAVFTLGLVRDETASGALPSADAAREAVTEHVLGLVASGKYWPALKRVRHWAKLTNNADASRSVDVFTSNPAFHIKVGKWHALKRAEHAAMRRPTTTANRASELQAIRRALWETEKELNAASKPGLDKLIQRLYDDAVKNGTSSNMK